MRGGKNGLIIHNTAKLLAKRLIDCRLLKNMEQVRSMTWSGDLPGASLTNMPLGIAERTCRGGNHVPDSMLILGSARGEWRMAKCEEPSEDSRAWALGATPWERGDFLYNGSKGGTRGRAGKAVGGMGARVSRPVTPTAQAVPALRRSVAPLGGQKMAARMEGRQPSDMGKDITPAAAKQYPCLPGCREWLQIVLDG